MTVPSESDLAVAIEKAAKSAFSELFSRSNEHFYYASLVTDGEAHAPIVSAWSVEALNRYLENEKNPEDVRLGLKWSYADSPYFAFGDKYFEEVRMLFSKRPRINSCMASGEWECEYLLRLRAMEKAMASLDSAGVFGVGEDRLHIVINAEVMPPDFGNTERAFRLNPKEALVEWLEEAAEPF